MEYHDTFTVDTVSRIIDLADMAPMWARAILADVPIVSGRATVHVRWNYDYVDAFGDGALMMHLVALELRKHGWSAVFSFRYKENNNMACLWGRAPTTFVTVEWLSTVKRRVALATSDDD